VAEDAQGLSRNSSAPLLLKMSTPFLSGYQLALRQKEKKEHIAG